MSYRDLDCDWKPEGKKPPKPVYGWRTVPGGFLRWTLIENPAEGPEANAGSFYGTGIARGILDTFAGTAT